MTLLWNYLALCISIHCCGLELHLLHLFIIFVEADFWTVLSAFGLHLWSINKGCLSNVDVSK